MNNALYEAKIQTAQEENNSAELAVGFVRYEAVRKLNARQFAELWGRCLAGAAFDELIDELIGEAR